MYIIVGADGREYGPVSVDQIRQWIAEGRANSQTRVRAEGSSEWKRVAEVTELAALLSTQAPPAPTSSPAPFPITQVPVTNQLAVAGMVLGILSLVFGCCCFGIPFNLGGIICSSMALSQISKNPSQQGKGYAIAGLVLSILSLVIYGFISLTFSFSRSDFFRKLNHL